MLLYKKHTRISMGIFGFGKGSKRNVRPDSGACKDNVPKKPEPDRLDRALAKARDERDFDALIGFMKDKDPLIRTEVAIRFGEIDGLTNKAIDALIDAIGDPNLMVRSTSLRALRHAGPAVHRAIPSLIQKIRTPGWQWYEKVEAIAILGCMGKESYTAIPSLLRATKDKEENIRIAASLALGMIGDRVAAETLEALAIHDQSDKVKDAALKGLLGMPKR